MLKKILFGLLAILLFAQFFQPSKNNGAAESDSDITHAVSLPDSVHQILKATCYDCHSNQTNYPWYSKITPVNWWLKDHIDEGKRSLNFTAFTTYERRDWDHCLEEIAEEVKKKSMPLDSYLWMHDEARLTDAQRVIITNWVSDARRELGSNRQ